jgi:hypothetical protein
MRKTSGISEVLLSSWRAKRRVGFVRASKDDFDLAREICAVEPAICDPNRPRVLAGSTPMVDTGPNEKKNYSYVIALE